MSAGTMSILGAQTLEQPKKCPERLTVVDSLVEEN